MSKATVMIMAGGTGGHIFPALAVARELQAAGFDVVWLGAEGGMETRIVPPTGIPLETIAIKGVRGNGIKRKLMLPFTLMGNIKDVKRIIKQYNVKALIGFGGFVTFPGGVGGKLAGLPLTVHEQNAIAGLSNKVLSRYANRVLYAFPKVFANAEGLVGNPVRADIVAMPAPEARFAGRTGRLRLLVVGGSLGAQVFNDIVPKALALLSEEQRPSVMHQSGRNKLPALQDAYTQLGLEAQCVEFIDEMVKAYSEADVIVCRAGALTVAELAAAGLGAVFVPYPHAVDDHQTFNAKVLVDAKAAVSVPQSQFTPEALADLLQNMDRATCLQWAQCAREQALPDAARLTAAAVISTFE
ncbi:undecaprenyldiphospho-muramoylpentapeptide beta-N-acetylglucosaminyltransferase [Vitreoscilla stercoraria]|uniref:UDP-N-acetylglucosamine--N-acetylmuramyl-(pentapeptide) pyrophosphoryl-undecaprenol N-acetylglucosamine transferase n=1 Tax=Vitreoscilla stercoraria TaxID=61 RepID=A0ABY4ECV9_VITST|nr:undecaprenyldiphospho-muramoylpentapeptide beta-N-acetylglucosaminyltransferase [Vitreoscilla stercoraria]UOO92760.1 undecaprenyldiphospho-muramoylpentapeptide beta-N-acetylglucosaminyltransferase [Vitreoscilla stercoraria]